MKIGVFGNCQSVGMAESIAALMPDAEIHRYGVREAKQATAEKNAAEMDAFASCDHVFLQSSNNHGLDGLNYDDFKARCASLVAFPMIAARFMQPDCHYLPDSKGVHILGPLGPYQSAIAAGAYLSDLSLDRAISLFNVFTYRKLGYLDFDVNEEGIIYEAQRYDYDFAIFFKGDRGRFMHTINHPAISIIFETAKQGLAKIGIARNDEIDQPRDMLSNMPVWPIYTGIAKEFSDGGKEIRFKYQRQGIDLSLREFVEASYDAFNAANGAFRSDLSDKVRKFVVEHVR